MFGLTRLEVTLALCGVLLAAFAFWLYRHDHKLIASHDAQLEATSATLKAEAEKQIADLTVRHAADVAANQEKLDEALKSNAILGDALGQRVRDFDAYRRSHPDLPRPAGGPIPAVPGECGAQSCGNLAVQLAERGNDLARSNGELAAALQSAQRDRDSLTGLPH